MTFGKNGHHIFFVFHLLMVNVSIETSTGNIETPGEVYG